MEWLLLTVLVLVCRGWLVGADSQGKERRTTRLQTHRMADTGWPLCAFTVDHTRHIFGNCSTIAITSPFTTRLIAHRPVNERTTVETLLVGASYSGHSTKNLHIMDKLEAKRKLFHRHNVFKSPKCGNPSNQGIFIFSRSYISRLERSNCKSWLGPLLGVVIIMGKPL